MHHRASTTKIFGFGFSWHSSLKLTNLASKLSPFEQCHDFVVCCQHFRGRTFAVYHVGIGPGLEKHLYNLVAVAKQSASRYKIKCSDSPPVSSILSLSPSLFKSIRLCLPLLLLPKFVELSPADDFRLQHCVEQCPRLDPQQLHSHQRLATRERFPHTCSGFGVEG
jgi:hypothetical protein